MALLCGVILPQKLSAQSFVVQGTVLDENGEAFAGVFVLIKGSSEATMTDDMGKFSISAKSEDVLVFSVLSYEEVNVTVGRKTIINVSMTPSSTMLEESTVVAYGTQRKASVIGSISTVNADELKTPVANISSALAGRMPGVVALQTSSEPGSSSEFWIRGVGTFGANSKPLIIVDGVEREMDLVDVDDIASFSILKDATATALYGVRGANGIVIITTKRGSEQAPKVTFKAEYGMTQPITIPKMASTEDWIDFYNELYTDVGATSPIDASMKQQYLSGGNPDLYPSVDWTKTIFKDFASTGKVNASVSGGTKALRYYAGGSYYTEGGIFNVAENLNYSPQINYNKFSFRSNVDVNLSSSTTLNLSLSTQYTSRNAPSTDLSTIYSHVMYCTPVATPTVFSNGALAVPQALSGVNPYNDLNNSGYKKSTYMYVQSLASLTQDLSEILTEGLKANLKFSWDSNAGNVITRDRNATYYYINADSPYNPDGSLNLIARNDGTNYLTMYNSNSSETIVYLESSLTYDRLFAEAHRVGGLFLFSMRSRTNNVPSSYIYAYPYRNMGIAGRATYSYRDRYFLEFNFGYNGSENFAPGHRFGFFPSYAVGYMLSNEPYWKNLKKYVDTFKIKASYGTVGNDQIGGSRRFAYNTTMNTSASGGIFGTNAQNNMSGQGITTSEFGNPNVAWEEAHKSNAGFEAKFLGDFSFTFDYFLDRREGIFIQRQSTPSVVGLTTTQYVNLGRMMNQGYDMSFKWEHKFSDDFFLSVNANYSFNRNRKLYDDMPDQVWKYQNLAGFAYNQQFGLIAEGLFESEQEIAEWPTQTFSSVRPGDIKYRDINGDGKIDSYDMVAIGYTTIPEITYGAGVSAMFKGFDCNVFFSGVSHVTRIIHGQNLFGASDNIMYLGQIFEDVAKNRWTLENQNNDAPYPRLSMSKNTNNQQNSTYWLRDMSFLRLKTVEFGYTLPESIARKAKFDKVRVYISGNNLLTFSKFKLWDPELDSSYGNAYPQMRTVVFGVNLNF